VLFASHLLNDGLEEGEVNNAVFISYWDHYLVSAKGWHLKREG